MTSPMSSTPLTAVEPGADQRAVEALARARSLVKRFESEPERNPATGTLEFALRDPDGYCVMVSAWS